MEFTFTIMEMSILEDGIMMFLIIKEPTYFNQEKDIKESYHKD